MYQDGVFPSCTVGEMSMGHLIECDYKMHGHARVQTHFGNRLIQQGNGLGKDEDDIHMPSV